MNRLDHLIIAAGNLEQGAEFIHNRLGVEIPKGGVHATQGTHNLLMQLGNEVYFEVIAIDPEGAIPERPRWFDLDRACMREAIQQQPRLITWAINTPDIAALAASAGFDIGTPTAMTRDRLSWQVGLTDDGRLLAGGLLPYCIQWHSTPHPSLGMADLGCRLQSLTLCHNRPDWLGERLKAMGIDHLVEIETLDDAQAPFLQAEIETPSGTVML